MFGFDPSGDKLDAGGSQIGQEPLAAFVDKRDIAQIDDAAWACLGAAAMLPARAQFSNPWASQLTAKRPPLFQF